MRVDRLFAFSGALIGSAVALYQGAYRTAVALALISAVALSSIKEEAPERWRDGQLHLVYTRQSRRVES